MRLRAAFDMNLFAHDVGSAQLALEEIPRADLHLKSQVKNHGFDLAAVGRAGNGVKDHGLNGPCGLDAPRTIEQAEKMRSMCRTLSVVLARSRSVGSEPACASLGIAALALSGFD